MWGQPHLNTQLYLNYKGFDTIECLEDYCLVRALHLGNNNIIRIEGLDRMSDLRSLCLEGNRITKIENLAGNLDLRQLNLEGNAIKRVEGLGHLAKLEHLNLSNNAISAIEDLDEMRSLPALTNIDVSRNELESIEGVVELWTELTSVKVLRYHGNPGVRNIEHYRKRLVNAMPNLTYLDERPVFPVERRSCAAWADGGFEAMHAAKRDYQIEKNAQFGSVDEDRKELVTRNRKLAIARIERQEKERAEKESEAESRRMQQNTVKRPETGDLEALASYEKSWQTKVSLHGVDGVRAMVSKEAGTPVIKEAGQEANTAFAQRLPQPTKPVHTFQPPTRGAGSRAELGPSPEELSARDTSRRGPAKCASDFAERSVFRHDACDNAVAASLEDRQAAVLGDDVWTGTATGRDAWQHSQGGPSGIGGGQKTQFMQPEAEVMPQLWETMLPQNRAAELACLDMNFAASSGGSISASQSARDALSMHPSMNCLD